MFILQNLYHQPKVTYCVMRYFSIVSMNYSIECRKRSLTIQQRTDGLHGSTIWDAGIILCKYLDLNLSELLKARHVIAKETITVIDLGSGTGICGIYMALLMDNMRLSGTVWLTDCEGLDLLESNKSSVKSDIVDIKVSKLTWGKENDLKGM